MFADAVIERACRAGPSEGKPSSLWGPTLCWERNLNSQRRVPLSLTAFRFPGGPPHVCPTGHSLEGPVGVLHDDCAGMPQDEAWNPALGCGALVSGGSEHQKHVLLIAGQNLNDLSLIDVDLILLHCRVIVCHQHGGDVATAATFTLRAGRWKEKRQRDLKRGW